MPRKTLLLSPSSASIFLLRSRQQDFYDQYSSSYSDSHYWYGSGYGSNSNLYDFYGSTPVEIPQFQHPSHSLLQQNGFTQQVYLKYKQQCLDGKTKVLTIIDTIISSFRTHETRCWTIDGNEYTLSFLVVLFARKFQSTYVR